MSLSSGPVSFSVSKATQTLEVSCSQKHGALLQAAQNLRSAFHANQQPTEQTQTAYAKSILEYTQSLGMLKIDVKSLHQVITLTHTPCRSEPEKMKAAYRELDQIVRTKYLPQRPSEPCSSTSVHPSAFELDSLRQQLEFVSCDNASLNQILESKEEQFQRLRSNAHKKIERKDAEIEKLTAEIDRLSNLQIPAEDSLSTQITHGLDALEVIGLRSELEQANAEKQQLSSQIADLTKAIATLTEERDTFRTKAGQLYATEQELTQLKAQMGSVHLEQQQQAERLNTAFQKNKAAASTLRTTLFDLPPPPPQTPQPSSSSSPGSRGFLHAISTGAFSLKKTTSWTRKRFWKKTPDFIKKWRKNPEPNNIIASTLVMGWCTTTLDEISAWMEASKSFNLKINALPESIDPRLAKKIFNHLLAASTEAILNAEDDDDDEWGPSSSPSTLPLSMSVTSLPSLVAGSGDSIFIPSSAVQISKDEIINRFRLKTEQIKRSKNFIKEIKQTLDPRLISRFTALQRANK